MNTKRKPKRIPYNYVEIENVGYPKRLKNGKNSKIVHYIGENRCKADITEATTTVIFGSSIQKIDQDAFRFERYLQILTFQSPSKLRVIGTFAFQQCIALQQLELPMNLLEIQADAFRECYNLKSVLLPPSIETIAERAFYFCSNLHNITLPSQLKYIGNYAFAHSVQTTPKLPPSIQSIHFQCFGKCKIGHQIFDLIQNNAGLLISVNLSHEFEHLPPMLLPLFQTTGT